MTRMSLVVLLGVLALTAAVAAIWRPNPPQPAPPHALEFVPPKGYVCYRLASPIQVDGRLDETAWAEIPWTDDFVDIEGDAKPKPRHRTRVKMAWDDQALYIAADLEEPHLWATLTQHDAVIFQDPDFEVFLDPDGDNHLYGELELNALNTTWDLLLSKPYRDNGRAVDAWEITGLKTAVHLRGTLNQASDIDQGWTIEIAWPWKSLKEINFGPTPPKVGDQWRINFSRVEWDFEVRDGKYRKFEKRPEHNWVWSPQGVIDMHRPETWGYLQFSDRKPGSDEMRPDPTAPARHLLARVYAAQQAYRKQQGRSAKSRQELGLPAYSHPSFAGPLLIESTMDGWNASIPVRIPDGAIRTVQIRSDSQIQVK